MFKNLFLANWRSLLKDSTFTLINLTGLTIGLASFLLIFIYVRGELSYDTFHDKHDRIFRLKYHINDLQLARIPPVLQENLEDYFPEITTSAKVYSRSASVKSVYGGTEKQFEETNVLFSDPEILDIMDVNVVSGQRDKLLRDDFTMIISEEMATKYFGDNEAVGNTLYVEGKPFQVMAVARDFPVNSHIHFAMILPFENMYDVETPGVQERLRRNLARNWLISHSHVYVLLAEGADAGRVNSRFENFIQEKMPDIFKRDQSFELQALADIHLDEEVQAQPEPPSNAQFVYILLMVGTLSLLISCINFINLSTARAFQKTKEIGVRKVLGVRKRWLVFQLLGESFFVVLLSLLLAVAAAMILLPTLEEVMDRTIPIRILYDPETILIYMGLWLTVGVLAGLYPSVFATNLISEKDLRNNPMISRRRGFSFRSSLITTQFAISITLITLSLVVFYQLDMLRSKPLGYNQEAILTVPIRSQNTNNVFGGLNEGDEARIATFETKLSSIPGVKGSTLSSLLPGFGMTNQIIIPEGYDENANMFSPVLSIDYDFLEVYEMELLAGRALSEEFESTISSLIINETALSAWNFGKPEEALGKSITIGGREGKVVGVVRDFHFLPLTQPIATLILERVFPTLTVFSIKLETNDLPDAVKAIEDTWKQSFPDQTFDFRFLDERLEGVYDDDERLGNLIGFFAIVAILLSCLGAYGLLVYIVSRKMKELAIRKVLGSTVTSIVFLLSRKFMLLIGIAFIIATPVSFWMGDKWLDDFSFRIEIAPWMFALAVLLLLVLLISTISIHVFRIARQNPVKSLRIE